MYAFKIIKSILFGRSTLIQCIIEFPISKAPPTPMVRLRLLAALLAGLVSAALADVTSPASGDVWYAGDPYSISWDPRVFEGKAW